MNPVESDEQEYTFGYIPSTPDDRDIPLKRTTNTAIMQLKQTTFVGSLLYALFGWIRFISWKMVLSWFPWSAKHGTIPVNVDMRGKFPAPFNQGSTNSCVSNAIAGIMLVNNKAAPSISRLACYYLARSLENRVSVDAGCSPRDALKVAAHGVCDETSWPYDLTKVLHSPPLSGTVCNGGYRYVSQTQTDIQDALTVGYPVMIGISVYKSMIAPDVKKSGIIPFPNPEADTLVGGHCVVIVGYKMINDILYFIIRNSWGDKWGDGGYGYIPSTYVLNSKLCQDLWVILP